MKALLDFLETKCGFNSYDCEIVLKLNKFNSQTMCWYTYNNYCYNVFLHPTTFRPCKANCSKCIAFKKAIPCCCGDAPNPYPRKDKEKRKFLHHGIFTCTKLGCNRLNTNENIAEIT